MWSVDLPIVGADERIDRNKWAGLLFLQYRLILLAVRRPARCLNYSEFRRWTPQNYFIWCEADAVLVTSFFRTGCVGDVRRYLAHTVMHNLQFLYIVHYTTTNAFMARFVARFGRCHTWVLFVQKSGLCIVVT